MNTLLKRLIEDHQNLQRVHDVLAEEMLHLSEGREYPDVELLEDIMAYLRSYPDRVHHPLEDRIYVAIRASIKDPYLLEMLEEIQEQHDQIARLTQQLSRDVNILARGGVISVEQIVADFRAYIELATEHLECENNYLLPAIPKLLSSHDLEVIRTEIDWQADPLFKQVQQGRYQRLLECICHASVESGSE